MMRIAILGATSQIAKDLVLSISAQSNHDLALFARRPEVVMNWLASVGLSGRYTVADFTAFSVDEFFDAVLNFVGVGNPAQAAAMGASIFDVTAKFDELALGYLRKNSACRYLFLSSGAVYGSTFDQPASIATKASIAVNDLKPQDWYGIAKLYAESRHRAYSDFSVVDIRVFNYFSRTQDIAARFLISDIVRSIKEKTVLKTSAENIIRDYLSPKDFFNIVSVVLSASPINGAFDCYSKAPVEKFQLLSEFERLYGLTYEISSTSPAINATGAKAKYFSIDRRLSELGYIPFYTSLEGVCVEAAALLALGGR